MFCNNFAQHDFSLDILTYFQYNIFWLINSANMIQNISMYVKRKIGEGMVLRIEVKNFFRV